jgi:histone H3/H4
MVHEEDLLSIVAMHRICKKAGAERVSDSASVELAKVLNEIGVKIARDALESVHAGRRTVKAKDIEIAASKMFGKR